MNNAALANPKNFIAESFDEERRDKIEKLVFGLEQVEDITSLGGQFVGKAGSPTGESLEFQTQY